MCCERGRDWFMEKQREGCLEIKGGSSVKREGERYLGGRE